MGGGTRGVLAGTGKEMGAPCPWRRTRFFFVVLIWQQPVYVNVFGNINKSKNNVGRFSHITHIKTCVRNLRCNVVGQVLLNGTHRKFHTFSTNHLCKLLGSSIVWSSFSVKCRIHYSNCLTVLASLKQGQSSTVLNGISKWTLSYISFPLFGTFLNIACEVTE